MSKHPHAPQVGTPDPESKTSPIYDRADEELPSQDLELEEGVCFFNGVRYPIGQYVYSGSDLLHCEERGIWVQKD